MSSAATAPSFGPLGFQPGWPKRVLLVALILSPLFAAVLIDMPMCPTAAIFGIPCPGCGLTRATLALFHGDLGGALRYHPLVFLATPMYFGVIGSIAFGYVRGGIEKIPTGRLTKLISALAVVTFFLLMGIWLARFFGAFGGPVEIRTFRASHR